MQFDTSNHRYSAREKQLAALAWLSEADERDNLFKTLGILIGIGALVIALFALLV